MKSTDDGPLGLGKKRKTIRAADLFCGGGGTSTGLVRAATKAGHDVDLVGLNHSPIAVETHKSNYPWARHICQPIENVRPIDAVPSGKLDILVASPSCTHHSTALGGKPVNDQLRSQPWHVNDWLTQLRVKAFFLENVPDIMRWGKVDKVKGRPIKNLEGHIYKAWIQSLRGIGYNVATAVIDAADFGGATNRKRWYAIGVLGKKPVAFPEPTHCDPRHPVAGRGPWRRARDIIDWTKKGESLITRDVPLSYLTILRIAQGMWALNGIDISPWIKATYAPCDDCGSCAGIMRATRTVARHVRTDKATKKSKSCPGTGKSVRAYTPDEVPVELRGAPGAARMPFVMAMGSGGVARGVDEPIPTVVGKGGGMLAEPFVLSNVGRAATREPQSTEEPLPTILTRDGTHVAEPFLAKFYGTNTHASVDDPLDTVTAGGNKFGVAEPFMMHVTHGGRLHGVDMPLPTVTTSPRGELASVESFLVGAGGPTGQGAPRSVDEPLPTVLAESRLAACEPYIVPPLGVMAHGGRANAPRSVDSPFQTLTQRGGGHIVEPFVLSTDRALTNRALPKIDEPLPTITGQARLGVVVPEACVVPNFGENREGGQGARWHDVDEPLPVVTGRGAGNVVEPVLITYYKNGAARTTDLPVPTLRTNDTCGLVVPTLVWNGQRWFLDILFRMLMPVELARAMGFPDDYVWCGNAGEVTKQIGNAVETNVAEAIISTLLMGKPQQVLDVFGHLEGGEVSA